MPEKFVRWKSLSQKPKNFPRKKYHEIDFPLLPLASLAIYSKGKYLPLLKTLRKYLPLLKTLRNIIPLLLKLILVREISYFHHKIF